MLPLQSMDSNLSGFLFKSLILHLASTAAKAPHPIILLLPPPARIRSSSVVVARRKIAQPGAVFFPVVKEKIMRRPSMAAAAQSKLPRLATADMISSLPDEILCHILSFLPTKHAVCTSGLSRRWKDIWTGLYELNLDNRNDGWENLAANPVEVPKRRDLEFCGLVKNVLRKHNHLKSLRRLRIHLAMEEPVDEQTKPDFLLPMGFASGESRLEEIDLNFEGFDVTGSVLQMRWIPETFYRLKLLKVLKFEGLIIMEITEKESVLLPSLEVLELSRVEIIDCKSLTNLVSGCPVLKTLHIEHWYFLYNGEGNLVTASLPSLKNLRIVDFGDSGKRLLCPMRIEAPSLEHLCLWSFAELQFLGGTSSSSPLPCLGSARVDIGRYETSKDGAIMLLTQISDAKEMWLSWRILSLLSELHVDDHGDYDSYHYDYVQLPIFPNLTHLTIELGGRGSGILHSLLKAASKLQYLGIELEEEMEWEECEEPASAPECLLSSLEEINVKYITGVGDDMKMVAYLLKAGVVLKKANMGVSCDVDNDIYRQCSGFLLNLPRGSSACEAHVFLSQWR